MIYSSLCYLAVCLFLKYDELRISNEQAINIIPETEIQSGDSLGSMIQLRIAPETGIRNFQTFNSETLTDRRRSSVFQIETAAADKKLSQPSAKKYSGANAFFGKPSIGIEIPIINKPPINSEEDVKTIGEILCLFRAMTTLVAPETKLFRSKKSTPIKAISAPD